MSDDSPKLEVRDASKNFGSLRAVSGRVDGGRRSGELRAIIGPNGAGKTTFFNLITGFFPPSSGEILLDGQNINRVPAAERVKMGMGRTFQITEIFPELTVRENARIAVETGLGFSLRAWLIAADKRRVADASDEVMTMANLTPKADRLVGELSHGDQRSAEIAMALALKPSLLLLDEPTAGMGDEETYQIDRPDPPPAPRFEVHDRADRARHARGVPSRRPHLGAGRGQAAGRGHARGDQQPTCMSRTPIWERPNERASRSAGSTPSTARAISCTTSRWRRRRAA